MPEKPSPSKGGQVARQTDRNVPFSAFGTFGNTDFLSDEAFPKYHHRSENEATATRGQLQTSLSREPLVRIRIVTGPRPS